MRAQSYTVLRQRYLTGGEALLNEWNSRFLASRTPGAARRRGASRSLRGAVQSAPVAGAAAGKDAGARARAHRSNWMGWPPSPTTTSYLTEHVF